MAQTGFTPLLIYSSSTATNAPTAGNLLNNATGSELAINIADGKLFYKDSGNNVQVIAWKTTPTTAGGTGLTSWTAGQLPYYSSGSALSQLNIGTSGYFLTSSGSAPQWTDPTTLAVTSISFGSTGLTPSTATKGAVTVAGTLNVANGGTGLTSLTAGYIPYGNGTGAFSSSSTLTYNGTALNAGNFVPSSSTIPANGLFLPTTNTLGFSINSTEAFRIDSSGNLQVGTTNGYYTTGRINSVQAINGQAAGTFGTTWSGDAGNAAVYIGKYDNNNTTSQIFVKFLISNTNLGSGQINANGAASVAFGSWSDERLKENIVDLPSQLDNILSLRPVEFDYKDGSGHQIGFIAQEMQNTYSDVVGKGNNGMLMITGWSKTEARLVKALQELNDKFDAYVASHP